MVLSQHYTTKNKPVFMIICILKTLFSMVIIDLKVIIGVMVFEIAAFIC